MGDLQCPARVWVAWPRSRADVDRWTTSLVDGLALHVVDQRHASPDLAAVADVHRGEDVLVLVDRAPASLPDLREDQVVPCEVDSSGLRPVGEPRTL